MLKQTQPRLSQLASAVAVVLGGITLLPAAHAAAPAAGVSISNIAVASYTDANGAPQTVNSNEVRTTVLQVASFTLEADRQATVNPNGQVALSHTLTNTGNGSDSFTIDLTNLGGDDIDLNNIAVYIDANGDGRADNEDNLVGQTITLPAGGSTNLIVVGQAPINATTGQVAQLTISATSTFDNTVTEDNTDTVTITGGPVINLVKSASVARGADNLVGGGDVVTYTITYTNTGNAPAVGVVITDLLPANVTYVAGSARWSSTGNTPLTDASDAADQYDFDAVGRNLTLTIPTVAQNTSGSLTFQVTIDAAAPAGQIVNTALVDYDDGDVNTPPVIDQPSNNSTITVDSIRLGTINDSATNPYADADRVPGDPDLDDTQTTTIPQGGTAVFPVYVHNTGNVSQIYEVTVDTSDLPAGSSVQVLRNGAPLTNITGTSAVDVGPVAVGEVVELSVRITLPTGFSETGPDTTNTIVTITPVGNPSATDSTILVIDNVLPATVDLTNGNVADYNDAIIETENGEGPYDPNTIVDNASTQPGVPVTFPIEIFNGGNSPDNFNLTADVPPGWTVEFRDPITGQVVTNTGNILPGETRELIAVVTPPDNALVDPTNDVVLTVTSPVSGLTDSIKNNVAVTEVRELALTPDRQGQIAPGGTVTYTHTLTNEGNVVEGDAPGEVLLNITNVGGINSVVTVGIDLNGDGELQINEIIQNNDLNSVLPGGLQPFTSYPVLVKVEAPSSALPGAQDIATIQINTVGLIGDVAAPDSVQVVDTTTVTAGQVRLVKTQAVDADCDGVADGAYGQGTISARPAECIVYRIVATNEGNAAVSDVVITDATPAFTTISTAPVATVGSVTSPAVGATGTVTNDIGDLAPAAVAQLDFGVQIND